MASGPGLVAAQAADRSCTSPEARQFDFWLGDWTIEQRILRQDAGARQVWEVQRGAAWRTELELAYLP